MSKTEVPEATEETEHLRCFTMADPEVSKVTQADKNSDLKINSVRDLQKLLHIAEQADFNGFVGVKIHARGGRLLKLVKFYEDHLAND